MDYLVGQIFLCLLIAFALGFLVGCFFCRSKRAESADDVDWSIRFDQLKQRHEHLKGEQIKLQQERDDWKEKHDALLVAQGATRATTQEYREGSFGTDYPFPVEEIEGIGKGFGNKLRNLGIETTEDLVNRCRTKRGWEDIADEIGLKERYVVRRWAAMAALMRIPGVMGQYAELLEFSGVESIEDLAGREPAALLEKMKAVNEREHRVKEVPSLDAVANWIDSAKSLTA